MKTKSAIGIVVLLVILWVAIPFITVKVANAYGNQILNQSGLLGDTFGSVNALFSGLALAGVAFAILMQRHDLELQRDVLKLQIEELKLQREELKLTRNELAKSANAHDETQKAMHKQTQIAHQTGVLNGLTAVAQTYGTMAPLYQRGDFHDCLGRTAEDLSDPGRDTHPPTLIVRQLRLLEQEVKKMMGSQ